MNIAEAREAARVIAKQIISGTVSPHDGAKMIWKDVLNNLEDKIPDDLWPFKSNASEIEDCILDARQFGASHDGAIAQCADKIVAAARRLVD